MSKWLGMGKTEARNRKIRLGLPHRCQEPIPWALTACFPGSAWARVRSGSGATSCPQALLFETRAFSPGSLLLDKVPALGWWHCGPRLNTEVSFGILLQHPVSGPCYQRVQILALLLVIPANVHSGRHDDSSGTFFMGFVKCTPLWEAQIELQAPGYCECLGEWDSRQRSSLFLSFLSICLLAFQIKGK